MTNFFKKQSPFLAPETFSNKRDEFDPAIQLSKIPDFLVPSAKKESEKVHVPSDLIQTIMIMLVSIVMLVGVLTTLPVVLEHAQKQSAVQNGETSGSIPFQP